MIVHIEAGDRIRAVEVRRTNGGFIVVIDGHERAVDVKEVDGTWSFLVTPPDGGPDDAEAGAGFSRPLDAEVGAGFRRPLDAEVGAGFSRPLPMPMRSYEVAFVEGPDGAMMVHVDGHAVPVSVAPDRPASAARGRGVAAQPRAGPQRITAPMPGKIVKVLVKPGDSVEARQGLVVVEAMKMENELRSRAPGTVSEVRVKEGSSVEAGAVLVVVES